MNQWIVDNKKDWKIKYVLHTGDITDDFDMESQWKNADTAMKIFDDAACHMVFWLEITMLEPVWKIHKLSKILWCRQI